MHHRFRLAITSLLLLFALSSTIQLVAATLLDAEKIKAALRTTTIEEGGFIERVVAMAQQGTLPPKLVETTFVWARKKPDRLRFQYFKRALIFRAAKLGIHLS